MHLNMCAIQYHSIVHLNNHYMEQRFFRLNKHYMEQRFFRLNTTHACHSYIIITHFTQVFTVPGKWIGSSVEGFGV